MPGRATATLNYLASPSPLREWVEIKREIQQLLERIGRLTQDAAEHELALRLAGHGDEDLYSALAADRERREE